MFCWVIKIFFARVYGNQKFIIPKVDWLIDYTAFRPTVLHLLHGSVPSLQTYCSALFACMCALPADLLCAKLGKQAKLYKIFKVKVTPDQIRKQGKCLLCENAGTGRGGQASLPYHGMLYISSLSHMWGPISCT